MNESVLMVHETPAHLCRAPARRFEDLVMWQKAHEFVLKVYGMTAHFPKDEMYGLTSQLRRAAVSIAANIAEGFSKRSKPEKARFLNISQGSIEEFRNFLILARDLGYTDNVDTRDMLNEVGKMVQTYSAKILASEF
jgi:four helix bundle protein